MIRCHKTLSRLSTALTPIKNIPAPIPRNPTTAAAAAAIHSTANTALHTAPALLRMANSKFEYVRAFERPDPLLPNTFIVIRLDGRSFHSFSARHAFTKPNDIRALHLMNAAAAAVVRDLPDIAIAYGVSDEFSFVLRRETTLFERREAKLVTTVCSSFTSWYVFLWPQFFPETPLVPPLPSFDGRAVCYPALGNVRDYLSWRQADCHINNLYNTTFWALVQQGGMTTQEAEEELKGTFAKDKNEILFSRFKINYNNEPEFFKKGSVIFRDYTDVLPSAAAPDSSSPAAAAATAEAQETATTAVPREKSKTQIEKEKKRAKKAQVVVEHVDIIQDAFWEKRPWILGDR
ncbi:uncharacterized protein LAJ45_02004 [Morchella importuna]|nr:uncharacterized protein LAJ45_02004 [Morchella importuna]KAH8154236.1 hypothetical protein LAJ45_02004 [Morchella importuna]